MTPPPRRSLVFHLGGVEIVLRPGALVLFGGIAAALDLTYLPAALPGESAPTYGLVALALVAGMIVTTLLHEAGHAIAYRLQGIWPVRITLRLSGGACAAVVYEDSPGRAFVRAMAGPAATAIVVATLAVVWRLAALPPGLRLIAATLAVFGAFDLSFNALPTHPRCDGAFALRALLWLLRGEKADEYSVLYVWRPLVLAAAVLVLAWLGLTVGFLPNALLLAPLAAYLSLALGAAALLALAWRAVATPVARRLASRHQPVRS